MKKSPLQTVTEKFKDKDGLVKDLEKLATHELWLGRLNEDKGLSCVSNAKLLRLHAILTQVKEKFGTRDGLIDAIRTVDKRANDDGFRNRLAKFSTPRLWDCYESMSKGKAAADGRGPAAQPAMAG